MFGERQFGSTDFRTGLLVVTKWLDTGSAGPVTNNPNARCFRGGAQSTTIPNADYPPWQVVRASTSAPHFFDPEAVQIGRADGTRQAGTGDFVDGGVSPANNPALQAPMVATIEGYRLGWPAGEHALQIVSVGTGRTGLVAAQPAIQAVLSLKSLMHDCADQAEAVMQWLSVNPTARRIDREMDKAQPVLGGRAMCTDLRSDVHLRSGWCAEHLGETLDDAALKSREAMDEPGNIPDLDRLGRLAGVRLVCADHFDPAFD